MSKKSKVAKPKRFRVELHKDMLGVVEGMINVDTRLDGTVLGAEAHVAGLESISMYAYATKDLDEAAAKMYALADMFIAMGDALGDVVIDDKKVE